MRLIATLALALGASALLLANPLLAADIVPPGGPSIGSATFDEFLGALLGVGKSIVYTGGTVIIGAITVASVMLPGLIKAKLGEWAAGARALRGDLIDKTLDVALDAGLSPAEAATAVIGQLPGTVRDGRFTPRQIEDRAKLRRQRKAPVG